ncbi:G patch domain-containing protein 4 [Eudromia elegans]
MSPPAPQGRGMRFAERLLLRHGWRRGRGLGRREDGIAEAIRVKVKCDTAGVGHDAAEPFAFHWWDHVFNEAAANVAVEAAQGGVAVRTRAARDAELSNKRPRRAGRAGAVLLYGRFVKAATLTARGEEEAAGPPAASESSEDDDEKLDLSSARRLTDEELVRVCGGRTAHKGARHGLTMSAKLARLEEQERAFLAAHGLEKGQPEAPESSPPAGKGRKKKKKKQSKDRGEAEQSWEASGEESRAPEEEATKRRKKKKKKKKHQELVEREESATEAPVEEADEEGHAGHSPKKKKKRKRRQEEAE